MKAPTAFGITYSAVIERWRQGSEAGLFRKSDAARREAALIVYATARGLRVRSACVFPVFGMTNNPCRWTGESEIFRTSQNALPYPDRHIKEVASNWDADNPPSEHETIRLILKANYGSWMDIVKALRYRETLGYGYFRVWEKKIQRGNHG